MDEDNLKDHITVASERNLDERCAVAGACMVKLSIKLPAVIDDLSNSTEEAYTAWPDRLYVIDREGQIAYKSAPGPYGFKPKEVEDTLRRLLSASLAHQAQIR